MILKNSNRTTCEFIWKFLLIVLLISICLFASFLINTIVNFVKIQTEFKAREDKYIYECFENETINEENLNSGLKILNDTYENIRAFGIQHWFEEGYRNHQREVQCYCKHHIDDLESINPKYDMIIKYCKEQTTFSFLKKYMMIFSIVILNISNFGIQYIIHYFIDFIPFKHKSSKITCECFFLFIVFSFNYLFIYYLYQNTTIMDFIFKLNYFVNKHEIIMIFTKKSTFDLFGDYIQTTMLIEIFRGFLNFGAVFALKVWGLYKSNKQFKFKRKLIKHLIPPEYEIEGKIAMTLTVLLVTTFYACQLPLIVLLGSFSFCICFWAEKFILLRLSKKPNLSCTVPMDKLIKLFPIYSFISIFHTIRCYGNPINFTISQYLFFSNENFKVCISIFKLILRVRLILIYKIINATTLTF